MSNTNIDHDEYLESTSTIRMPTFEDDETEETPVSVPMRRVMSRTEQLEQLLLSLHDPSAPRESAAKASEANQRQFARCPLSGTQTSGILTLNGRSYDFQLAEMSIGGFGVIIPGLPNLKPGSEGRLRAPGLNYIVAMTRSEIRPEGTYVGLRQIEEIISRDPYWSNVHPPMIGYLLAGVAGALIATLMYFFKTGV